MEYEKETQKTDVPEFLEKMKGLRQQSIELQEISRNAFLLQIKVGNWGMCSGLFGIIASILSLGITVALGYKPSLLTFMLLILALPGPFFSLINLTFDYRNPKTWIYKFLKKPQWLNGFPEKQEIYSKSLEVSSTQLADANLQWELLEYFKNYKEHICSTEYINFECQYVDLMANLSEKDYINSVMNIWELLSLIENNKQGDLNYYQKLKRLVNPNKDIKKWL